MFEPALIGIRILKDGLIPMLGGLIPMLGGHMVCVVWVFILYRSWYILAGGGATRCGSRQCACKLPSPDCAPLWGQPCPCGGGRGLWEGGALPGPDLS